MRLIATDILNARVSLFLLFLLSSDGLRAQSTSACAITSDLPDAVLPTTTLADISPAALDHIVTSSDFNHVATFDRGSAVVSAFDTALVARQAEQRWLDAFQLDQWELLSTPINGFRPSNQLRVSELCSDDLYVQLVVTPSSSGSCVEVQIRTQSTGACMSKSVTTVPASLGIRNARKYAPTLQVPVSEEGASISMRSLEGPIFGSMEDYRFDSEFLFGMTVVVLHEIFSTQLLEQGWEETTSWTVDTDAASVWQRDTGDGPSLVATLYLSRLDTNRVRANMRIKLRFEK